VLRRYPLAFCFVVFFSGGFQSETTFFMFWPELSSGVCLNHTIHLSQSTSVLRKQNELLKEGRQRRRKLAKRSVLGLHLRRLLGDRRCLHEVLSRRRKGLLRLKQDKERPKDRERKHRQTDGGRAVSVSGWWANCDRLLAGALS